MSSQSFLELLKEKYSEMLSNYNGGLSNTSTSKFDDIRAVFEDALGLPDSDEYDKVYAIGAGTRPGNIEVRLNQGLRASIHTVLGLAFVKANDMEGAIRISDSAVVTVNTFLKKQKANYDSILILVEVNGEPVPTRLISYEDSPVTSALTALFSGVTQFEHSSLPRVNPVSKQSELLSSTLIAEIEKWKIPEPPNENFIQQPLQRLIEGCPGSGKSYALNEQSLNADRVIRTVFHPESGFSDFIGYLAPETAYKIEDPAPIYNKPLIGTPHVYYEFCCGPMLEAYILSVLNPSHSIVLIIEELSRAHASLVFGDTLQLLDRVAPEETSSTIPPGYSRYEISPRGEIKTLLNSLEAQPDFTQKGGIRFPPNLHIWATMNRADQNARQLDTAFLRRWKRSHISYDQEGALDEIEINYLNQSIQWGSFRKQLNQALLNHGIREDKLVGAYFLTRNALSSPEEFANDLLAYIWHDILREDGYEVFPEVHTFSQLKESWLNGTLTVNGIHLD